MAIQGPGAIPPGSTQGEGAGRTSGPSGPLPKKTFQLNPPDSETPSASIPANTGKDVDSVLDSTNPFSAPSSSTGPAEADEKSQEVPGLEFFRQMFPDASPKDLAQMEKAFMMDIIKDMEKSGKDFTSALEKMGDDQDS